MRSTFKQVSLELQKGMRLAKCRKCGCMHTTLEKLLIALPSIKGIEAKNLLNDVKGWLRKMETVKYACFKCKYCFPPEAMNILTSKFPSIASLTVSSGKFRVDKSTWPHVKGEYTVVNKSAPVAVSTLASDGLSEELSRLKPKGLCIVGKTETENIGIDKIIKNIVGNPAINFLIVAGKDPEGHRSGETLLALWKNGVDKNMRVIGSSGSCPILKNVSCVEIDAFRKQVQTDNLIGCRDVKIIGDRVKELSKKIVPASSLSSTIKSEPRFQVETTVPKIKAEKPKSVRLDKAGYFVIIPSKNNGTISVEHYNYDNKLLRIIEGKNSRDIYRTLIDNNWITDLSHAAYIGKEIARAEMAIKMGNKYVQEGA